MGASSPFFTLEDANMSFNLFCAVFGIGTLGMPANFSRAGPALAVCAMLFMAFANIYASVVCSKVMLVAPRSVKTFGDLGEWCMGRTGRWLVLISQMAVCFMVACAFLVLGGILLDGLFPAAFTGKTWIILMAASCVPICLTPTMKEGAGVAFAGCLCTLLADFIALGVLLHGMRGHPSVPAPEITFEQVATTFGNLSLSYGAGIYHPSLQRQHSQPARMPRVIFVTLGVVSVLFFVLAVMGYSAVGCQISGNLLFTIYSNSSTGLTKLGFRSDWGAVVLAYLFMQLHIQIAFAVILHPVFYLFERVFLGMHTHHLNTSDEGEYANALTPQEKSAVDEANKPSLASLEDQAQPNDHEDEEDEAAEYAGRALHYIPLRLVVISALTIISILLKDQFLDLADFVGASAISVSCILLPILFYFQEALDDDSDVGEVRWHACDGRVSRAWRLRVVPYGQEPFLAAVDGGTSVPVLRWRA
ncbi:hypothetical protein PINS_up013550 [Pythium insidiosum]|nr:hypothetical protein PINS_up013550 [Pythium insidiosum]